MDKRTTIGMLLIMVLLYAFMLLNKPSKDQIEAAKDAEAIEVSELADVSHNTETKANIVKTITSDSLHNDSIALASNLATYGPFASSAIGRVNPVILQNDLIKVTLSNKGGQIIDIELNDYKKVIEDDNKKEIKSPLHLMDNSRNVWSYHLPIHGLPNGLGTKDLVFQTETDGNSVTFTARTNTGGSIRQTYTLTEAYDIDYNLEFEGLEQTLIQDQPITLNWVTHLGKLEKNVNYERRYSTVYYKEINKNPDHCNCVKDDKDNVDKELKWVSHSNQFFNTTLIADASFGPGLMQTFVPDKDAIELKTVASTIEIPFNGNSSEAIGMTIYAGPNEFERLHKHGYGLDNIIPFGSNIFGTINRWVIRPMFNMLNSFCNSKGLSIILLTLVVKMVVFPLTYRSLKSASKMQALKPEMDKLKDKYKDDSQKIQMETMKLYQEYGVNPAGGCFPMVLQMPIWFAIFRFFPASIQFRQEPFLWATDLSSYDVFFRLPSEIPGFGGHISLFALLWAISSVIYSVYNMKNMNTAQMSDQMKPMMYMQYFMPIMFFFVFNNYASGLSCYFFFSNMINIIQTVITKNYIIDNKKIRAQLEQNKSKPKKQGGFQERLQKALADQQKIAQDRQQSGRTNNKKKR